MYNNADIYLLKPDQYYKIILYCLLISILIYGSFALKMDFQKFDFIVPDSFYMLSSKFWVFLLFVNSLLIVFFLKAREQFFNALLITTSFIFIFFPFVQWPNVMGIDQFTHTSTAKLAENGLLLNPTRIISDVYLDYPVTSIILSTFNFMTGFEYTFVATVLALVIKAVTILMLYVLSNKVFDKKIAYSVVLIFILGNFRFNQYYQLAPQAIAFFLFIFLLYAYFDSYRNRSLLMLIVLAYVTIVLCHPFTSFFALGVLVSFLIMNKILPKRVPTMKNTFFLFVICFWLFWQFYPALPSLEARSSNITTIFTDATLLTDLFEEGKTAGRAVYSSLLLNYQRIIQIFLFLGSIIGLVLSRNRIPRIFIAMLVGFILLVFQLILTSKPPQLIPLDKVLYFGTLPASLLTTYFLERVFRSKHFVTVLVFRSKHFVTVLVFIIIALVPLSFFSSNQYTFMDSIKTWEIESTSFASKHIAEQYDKTATMDSITSKVYTYHSYDSQKVRDPFLSGYYSQRNADDPNNLYRNNDIVFITFRQKVDWYYNQNTAPNNWDELEYLYQSNPFFHKFYDDYYTTIYIKT